VFGFRVFVAQTPAPRPILWALHEAGLDRIRQDISDRILEVLLGVDYARGEPFAEKRALSLVASVVLPRVVALEPLNGSRQLCGWALHDGVVVRVHEAVRVERQPETPYACEEEQEEQPSVPVRAEEHRLVHRVCREVEISVRKIPAANSRHAANGRGGEHLRRPGVTLPTHFRHGFASRGECQTLAPAPKARQCQTLVVA
jgi:hypothetical protein